MLINYTRCNKHRRQNQIAHEIRDFPRHH